MSFKVHDESTKTTAVYVIMPKKILVVSPTAKKNRALTAVNYSELITFQDSLSTSMGTFYYKLPEKGIALEEYIDYFVINVGLKVDENAFGQIIEIATQKEKGLILKPPKDPTSLFLIDKLVTNYNNLNGYESIRF